MNSQNIHTEKLDLISWISQLQDIKLIEKLQEFKNSISTNDFIPEWHKEIVRDRLLNTDKNSYISLEEIESKIKFD